MDDEDWLAARFEDHRAHLRAVAYRMLGSASEADDAVQEAWLRLSRSDTSAIQNLGGWLTTAVARTSLDMLRRRTSRREDSLQARIGESLPIGVGGTDPEHEAVLADSVGLALLVVLEKLTPAERLAFVLHDLFAVPFEEIAPIVGRTPAATRQLASRARRRVQGAATDGDADPHGDIRRKRAIVDAFLAASHRGDFEALLELLDPDAVVRADEAAVASGATALVSGATAVAQTFAGRARGARTALIDGAVGAVWSVGGRPRVAFGFTILDGQVVGIELIADPGRLDKAEIVVLEPDSASGA